MDSSDIDANLTKPWRDVPITASAEAYADENYRTLTLQLYLTHAASVLALLTKFFRENEGEQYPLALRKLLSQNTDRPVRKEEIDAVFQSRLINEMLVCRVVDNFLAYIVGLLTEIFKQRPEALRSKETVTWEFVLGFDDTTALRHALAELKVDRLAYSGVEELAKKLEGDMNLELFTPEEPPKAARAVEVRNLIVHNRGRVNVRSAKKAPELAPLVGQYLELSDSDVISMLQFLHGVVRRTDSIAIRKFGIPSRLGYVQPHIPED
jgi:hypothetical protein